MRTLPLPLAAVVAAASLSVLAGSPAWAQSCGGCVDAPVPVGGAQRSWLGAGELSARLSSEYEVKDRTFKGHGRVPNDFDETLRIRRLDLSLRFGLTDDWSLGLDLHDPVYRYRLQPPGGRRTEITVRGPGDTGLRIGRWWALGEEERDPFAERGALPEPLFPAEDLLRTDTSAAGSSSGRRASDLPRTASLTAWGGISIPTGDVKKPNESIVARDFSVSNLQTGTGTFDPFAELRLDVPTETVRLYARAAAAVPLAENRHDYRTAATLSFGVGAEADLTRSVRASLSATFQRVGTDEFRGEPVGVGGGKWIYLTPGLSFDLSDTATLDMGVRLTVFRDADTKIVDSAASFQAAITIRF